MQPEEGVTNKSCSAPEPPSAEIIFNVTVKMSFPLMDKMLINSPIIDSSDGIRLLMLAHGNSGELQSGLESYLTAIPGPYKFVRRLKHTRWQGWEEILIIPVNEPDFVLRCNIDSSAMAILLCRSEHQIAAHTPEQNAKRFRRLLKVYLKLKELALTEKFMNPQIDNAIRKYLSAKESVEEKYFTKFIITAAVNPQQAKAQ